MKLNKTKLRTMFRHNFREIIFVFLAFMLMAAVSYFSVGYILRERLLDRASEMISAAEANVRAGLSEVEAFLLNAYYIVQDMIEQDAPNQEILEYLTATTEWMRLQEQGLLNYYGIYGFIKGEFFDSINLNPNSDYIPQTRPWYQTAIRSAASVGYTTPYVDWRTGDSIISAVRNIFDKEGRIVGILAVDAEISWLSQYIKSLEIASGGYGILVNQNMSIMAHPDNTFIGLQLQDLGGTYGEIARRLRSGENISALRTENSRGELSIVFLNRIFNGWYIGIVTPYYQFFRDLYAAALILIFIGLVLSSLLCYLLLRISAAKMRADEENKSKSLFLANMSHEIRTPMNAITGMAELLLRGELSREARGYAQDIKQAGNNLISIINDILDISKVEAGKLEIISSKYLFSSLLNDTVNIIRMRLANPVCAGTVCEENPVQFNTRIEGNIPNGLIGDVVRMRQILINLLSNAAKYTEQGKIDLIIKEEKRNDKQIWLKIKVSDTGIGIKPEDMKNLFEDFIQFDTMRNLGIEGTGLGLAITKRLCVAMGGSISVKSEYGKGSTFTVIIPQEIESEESFSAIQYMENKIDNPGMAKFTIPDARILIVDDIITNLKVAMGLLSPYQAKIDTCVSGAKALELVKQNNYDLVFMDHMMPDMDGIEAAALIRSWEKEQRKDDELTESAGLPVIALTANAITGMRDMFLDEGFNDFIAKPIDVTRLSEILDRWIPKEKKVLKEAAAPEI